MIPLKPLKNTLTVTMRLMRHSTTYALPAPWEAAVADWLVYLAAGGLSTASRRTMRSHIRSTARHLGVRTPATVTADMLLDWLARDTISAHHRHSLGASLRGFYRWAIDAGHAAADPTAGLPVSPAPVGAPKPATDQIWRATLGCADPQVVLMARLAGEAGLRRAEVAAVHTDDLIDTPSGPELIVHGKGARQRVVPINAALAAAIRDMSPGGGGWLFPGRFGDHLTADNVGRRVSDAMGQGWSMHKLRHRYASRGYAGTGNLRAVQEALGHASVATTQRYTAVSRREIRAVSDAARG